MLVPREQHVGDLVVDGGEDAEVEDDAGRIVAGGAVGGRGEGVKVVNEVGPAVPVEEDEEVGQGLAELVLEVGLVQLVGGGAAAVGPSRVLEQSVFEVGEAGSVEALGVDGRVDDLEAHQAHDLGRARGLAHEEVEARLPGLGPATDLVEVVIGLGL